MSADTTDPSKELEELGRKFRNHKTDDKARVVVGLAEVIGVDQSSPEYLEILSLINRRLLALEGLLGELDNSEISKELKKDVVGAARSFMQLVGPAQAFGLWNEVKKNLLSDTNLTALRWFSQTARKHRPLRMIPKEEVAGALQAVDSALDGLLAERSLPIWVQSVLIDGLNRTRFVLQWLPYFGHEIAILELLAVNQKAVSALSDLNAAGQCKGVSVTKFFNALLVAGGLFILPDQAVTAFDKYRGWTQRSIEGLINDAEQRKQQTLLLPSPAALAPREEQLEDGAESDK